MVVSFEHCFVQTSLQRVCGGHVSSNIFLIQVSIEICSARISLQRVFKRNVFEGILVIRSSVFLVEIPFPNLLAGNVPLEILSYRFLSYFFGSDFSSKIFWYLLSSDFFLGEISLQSLFGR